MDGLTVQQTPVAEEITLLRVVPDHVEAAVADGCLTGWPGNQVGDQAVGPCINFPGWFVGPWQRDAARHGLLIDQAPPQQNPRIAGVRGLRVNGSAHRASCTVSTDHQLGPVLAAVRGQHIRALLAISWLHGSHPRPATHGHTRTAHSMLLQPSLKQVPGRGVAIAAVKDRGLGWDAGHLPEQGDIHAQAPATVNGAGRALLEHGYADLEPR